MYVSNKNKMLVFMCFLHIRRIFASDFFIAKQYNYIYYVCVTNSSYPMSWVQEDIKTWLSYESHFIPPTNENEFDSRISLQDPRTLSFIHNPWSHVSSSVNSEVNGIILDRRWEELEAYMTKSVKEKGTPLKYTTVLNNLRNDFEIPFSIRLEREGHVFLCDGDYPPNSNCYWLLLQAWGGDKTAIRKCSKGYIPSEQKKWPSPPCFNNLKEQDHTNKPDSRYFSNHKWSHLKITKKGNVLSLFSINNKKDEKNIITLEDEEPIIGVTHMIIHSKQVNGLWKIHNMEFIYTTEESTKIHLGNPINPLDNYLCISLFIAMCISCTMTLTLQDYHRSDVIEEKIYKFSGPGWSEIKFTTENIKENNNRVTFLVATSSSSYDRFWAIDDIRICQRKEFREIALTEDAKCQLMSEEDNVISLSTKVQRLDSNCPEDSIGDFCVPCNWVFFSCERVEVCQKDKCVCSAGYQGFTKNYQCCSECPSSFYGHGCLKQCPNCPYNECIHVDGTCKYQGPCLEDYTGPKCDIRLALIFKKPPETTKVDYSEAIVIVKDFTIEKGIDEEPETYFFQYKLGHESDIYEWMTVGSEIKFNQSRKITIRDLYPGTKYFLRAVIVSDSKVSYEKSYVKFSSFETLCDELTKDDIITQQSNTSAIILRRNSGKLCDFYHYEVQAVSDSSPSKSGKDPIWRNRTAVFFDSLKEFTRYTVTFRGRSKVKTVFRTTEGIPDRIRDLTCSEVSARTVEIQWSKPDEIRGNFEHYIVEYGIVSYLACRARLAVPTKARLKILDSVARVNNLTPFATYSFSVSVANSFFESPPVTNVINTKASDNIGPKEIPIIDNLAPKSNLLEARLNTNCVKVRGPLMVKASAVCSDKWCDTTRKPKTLNIVTSNSLHLDSLSAFSNYTLYLQICRNQTYCSNNVQSRYFKTQPAAPSPVDNLLVYSKNKNSVSLRWTPPYPPNGILEKYYIQYSKWSGIVGSKIIEIDQCALWTNFHCATIDGLETNLRYTFYVFYKVQAQNKEPETYGGSRSIAATANKEAPQPPYDLTIDWSAQNDLELKWKHPNESNGEITCFNIQLICGGHQTEKKLEIVDNMYKLIYNYTIESTEIEPSKNYDIYVSSDNGIEGSPISKSDTSPPAIPELEGDLQISDINNKTATVTISRNKTNDNVRFLVLISEEKHHEITIEDLANFNLIFNCSVNKSIDTIEITIGDDLQPNGCESTKNPPLQPATEYTIVVQLINTYAGKSRSKIFSKLYKTTGKPLEMSHTQLLGLLMLLFIPIAVQLYIKRDKVISLKSRMLTSNHTSTELLELNEDQIPLSQNTGIQKKPTKKIPDANPSVKIYSKPIKITEFEEYVRNAIKNGELERQHALFPRGQTKPWTCGSLKENKSKNRYNNLLAYDHSRVVLAKIDGNPHSDYINANYIDGHKLPRAYIATQGPKVATLDDFWRMIWQENVRHIANLANIYEGGKKKLEKYWPDINETIQYGKITVQHLSTTVFADFEHRFFDVTYDGETRKVDQLHFSSWPDHGVPIYSQSLVPFLQKVLQMPLSSKSPIVVHCSAGVGRTGTILLCDICLRMAARDGSIDVLRNLQLLREQRANMVHNIEQYKLAHLVVLECLVGLHTSIECSEIAEGVEKMLTNGSLSLQMRYLKDTQWQDQAMKSVGQSGVELSVVQEKNRFEDVIPEIQGCIMLPRYPPEDESSVYINAVKVDGFRSPGRYIVTQQPMPNTLGDFWRLIDNNDICVIISLNEINAKDQTSCKFWPSREKPTMKPVPYISLKYVKTIPSEYYDVISIHLMSETRREHLLIQIVAMKDWPSGVNCPNNMEQFLAFWEESDSISRQSHPVVVTCYDGVTASGLYVAMSFIIEKMKLEQVCDVCQAVRTVRHNREQFVQDSEQFEFLYRAAVLYIGGFKPYANFN